MKYHLVQLGCSMNQADTERIASVLSAMGYAPSDTEDEAEILGVVACSVRQKAIDKVYSKIAKWNDWKNSRPLLTFVSGCILPSDREKFLERFDLLFSINELPRLPSLIGQYGVPSQLSLDAERMAEANKVAMSFGPVAEHDHNDDGSALHADGHGTAPNADRSPETLLPLRPVGPVWLKGLKRPGYKNAVTYIDDSDNGDFAYASNNSGNNPAARAGSESQANATPGFAAGSAGVTGVPGAKTPAVGRGILPHHISEQKITRHIDIESARRAALKTIRIMQADIREQGGADAVAKRAFNNEVSVPDPMGGFWDIAPKYTSRFEAFIPIQNGCDKFCTFCAVPYTRGREVSRPSAEILAEVRRLVAIGYKTITLLGQNVNSYGLDRKGSELSFAQLLREIGEIGKASGRLLWVYFTSPHPRDMTEDVLTTIASYESLAKWIHLPIQSGDDKVLFRMNRNHSVSRYRVVAQSVRRILPAATLFTDIIVGFSGESDEQFAHTREAMRAFQYNMAFIAMYSPRPGAASSRWEDDIPLETKKARLHDLTEVLHETAGAYTARQIGKTHTMFVSAIDEKNGYATGTTEGKVQMRFALPEGTDAHSLLGRFVLVKIEGAKSLSMEGSFQGFDARDRVYPDVSTGAAEELVGANMQVEQAAAENLVAVVRA